MIEIKRFGSQAVIVDEGRYNFRRFGVPISGAMDRISAARANSLVHNALDCALLELYQPGHELFFHAATYIALAGAEAELDLGDKNIYADRAIFIPKNTRLSIGRMTRGCRIYLAVRGGIRTQKVMGSRSPIPGFLNRHLYKGDKVSIPEHTQMPKATSSVAAHNIDLSKSISCFPGPEWQMLSERIQNYLLSQEFQIDQKSDRMGYRISGDPVPIELDDIYSTPVMPGTVQILPGGLPLILMRECQTTGGYPRIFQISEDSINQLAQRKPGDAVRFELIH